MKRTTRMLASGCLACVLALGALGCSGGGRTAVIGVGNRDNNLGANGIAEEVAEVLAGSEATPEVTDAMITEIFAAILEHARDGDAEAALIVLRVAEVQREAEEG